MSKMFLFFLFVCVSIFAGRSVFASAGDQVYSDGEYHCQNAPSTLPKNIYKIKTVDLSAEGLSLPYVEIIRFYSDKQNGELRGTKSLTIRGFATVISYDDGTAGLRVMNNEIPFKDGKILKCLN